MSRLFPHPLLSAALLAVWLLLNNTVAAGHILLGALLAVAVPLAIEPFWRRERIFRRPQVLLRLVPIVLWDIVVANVTVARLVLGPLRRLEPRFIEVPLEVTHPFAISALASIVTMTPGTVSAVVSEDRRRLLVHGLHVPDEAAVIASIKVRYEAPLKELFEDAAPS
ncbi:MAG: Na+/H+ antiporter subunit E [Gammaproteobacteria bacterium]